MVLGFDFNDHSIVGADGMERFIQEHVDKILDSKPANVRAEPDGSYTVFDELNKGGGKIKGFNCNIRGWDVQDLPGAIVCKNGEKSCIKGIEDGNLTAHVSYQFILRLYKQTANHWGANQYKRLQQKIPNFILNRLTK